MRKLVSFFVASALGLSSLFAQDARIALDASSAQENCSNISYQKFDAKFSFKDVELYKVLTESGSFVRLVMDGTSPTSTEFGSPETPILRKLIAIPVGATPVINVKNYSEKEYSLNEFGSEKVYPYQAPVSKCAKPEDLPFAYNPEAYAVRGFQSTDIVEVEILGTMRGVRLAAITVNPIVYDAAANKIRVRNNIDVELSFQGADVAATTNLFNSTFSPYYLTAYSELFNAEMLMGTRANNDFFEAHPDLLKAPVQMLVIVGDNYTEAIKPWLKWKAQKGFYVDVYKASEAGTSYTAITKFVKGKYEAGVAAGKTPTFIALVGDNKDIPGKVGDKTGSISDLGYCDFTNDYIPELYCFRMSVEKPEELTAMIDKTISYEKATMPDKSYLAKALLIAGVDGNWNPKVGQPTIKYAKTNYYNAEHGYNEVNVFLNSYSNCYASLNTGVGYANYTAHGSQTSWADPSFSNSDVNSLSNKDKYFLAVGNCCITADFAYSRPCFAETMTRAKEKGAYAYIGSSPSSYWNEDYYWSVGAGAKHSVEPTVAGTSTGAFDASFMEDSYNTVSSIMWAGNMAVEQAKKNGDPSHINPQYYWQAYHTFGDGSIMPYRAVPKENNASIPATLEMNQASYTISTTPNTYVAISKDGELYGVGLAGADGKAKVEMTKQITADGNYDVVATRSGYLPIIKTVAAGESGEPSELAPVTNLKGSYDDGRVTLSWTAPASKRNVVLEEAFEAGIPDTWKTIDADGDNKTWEHAVAPGYPGHNGGNGVRSNSWEEQQILTPDNWLITPQITVPENGKLSYWVVAQDAQYPSEKYGVFVSETTAELAAFTKEIFSETLTAKGDRTAEYANNQGERRLGARGQATWRQREVDLKDYAGKKIYLALRHWESTDVFALVIDDVRIEGTNSSDPDPDPDPQPTDFTYNVYRDGEFLKNVATTSYEDIFKTPGAHKYEVEVKYANGLSPKVAVNVTVPKDDNPTGEAIIFLEAENVWGDNTGYQMFLDKTAQEYGASIPAIGALVVGCDIPEGLNEKFSHKLPTTAVISCQPEDDQWVVTGEAKLSIPAGTYDYCIANPEPGKNVWIAGGDNGRKDDYVFEANKEYHFKAQREGDGDGIEITIAESIEEIVSAMNTYGIEGFVVIEADKATEVSIFDLNGRRIATQLVDGKAMIPAQAGVYLVQVKSGSKSHATKVIVK